MAHRDGADGSPSDRDRAMRDYLRSVDLQQLDLSHIVFEDEAPAPLWIWARLALLAGSIAALLWLPGQNFYLLHPQLVLLSYALGCVAMALGWSLQGQILLALRHGRRLAQSAARGRLPRMPALPQLALPPHLLRLMYLGGGVGMAATVYFLLPREAQWQGSGYSGQWFLAVGMAVLSGIVLGRWLIMQAEAARERPAGPPAQPFVAPPWMKWATLALLICGALFANYGHHLLAPEGDGGFATTGVGFGVGIFAAIWLARRFDELERHWKAGGVAPRAPTASFRPHDE